MLFIVHYDIIIIVPTFFTLHKKNTLVERIGIPLDHGSEQQKVPTHNGRQLALDVIDV
jgi:hypothetical protein